MKPDMYCIENDAQNHRFVKQIIDELDKNHQLDSTEIANAAKMYERLGNNGKKTPNFFVKTKDAHLDLLFCTKYQVADDTPREENQQFLNKK